MVPARKSKTWSRPSPARALISATGAPSSCGELAQIQVAVATAQIVGHVQDDQRGQTQRQNGRGQHEVAPQVGGIQHQQHGFRFGRAGARAVQNVVGDLLVFGARGETVDAGEIDDADGAAIGQFRDSGVLLHGDAGEVGHLLAQAGEAIEERRLAGVGRPDQRHGAYRRRTRAVARPPHYHNRGSCRNRSRNPQGMAGFCLRESSSGVQCRAAGRFPNHPPGRRADRRRGR